MYSIFKCPVKLSVFVYILVALLILYVKPNIIFMENGNSKGFGCDMDCEFFNYPVIIYSFAIIITFFFEYISINY